MDDARLKEIERDIEATCNKPENWDDGDVLRLGGHGNELTAALKSAQVEVERLRAEINSAEVALHWDNDKNRAKNILRRALGPADPSQQ